jgi:hypothetical protein
MTSRLRSIAVGTGIAFALACGTALAAPQVLDRDSGLSAETMSRINSRVVEASRIANQIRSVSPMNDSQFVALSQALLGASEAGLAAAAGAKSPQAAFAALRSAGMQKTLGSTTTDFVFKPIVPCRLLDTRSGAGTPLAGGVPFGVDFDGGNPGNAAGCTFAGVAAQTGNIGTGRAALAINLTVTQPSGPGFIQARPVGSTNVTSNQNFSAGQTVAAYAVIQDAGTAAEFELFASTTTHAIVDVMGVFSPAEATALECQTLESAVTAIANGAAFTVSAPACPAGFTATGPTIRNTSTFNANFVVNNLFSSGSASYTCQGQNTSGVTVNFQCGVKCCRVPGG